MARRAYDPNDATHPRSRARVYHERLVRLIDALEEAEAAAEAMAALPPSGYPYRDPDADIVTGRWGVFRDEARGALWACRTALSMILGEVPQNDFVRPTRELLGRATARVEDAGGDPGDPRLVALEVGRIRAEAEARFPPPAREVRRLRREMGCPIDAARAAARAAR